MFKQHSGNLAEVGRSREKEGRIQRGRELLRRAPGLMITDPEKQVFTVCYILHCLQDVGALSRKDCWSHRCLSVSRMPNNIRNMFGLFNLLFLNMENKQ